MINKTLKFEIAGKYKGEIQLNRMTGKAIYIIDGKRYGNDVMRIANQSTVVDGMKLQLDDGKKYDIKLQIDKTRPMKDEPDLPWRYRVFVNGKTVLSTSD